MEKKSSLPILSKTSVITKGTNILDSYTLDEKQIGSGNFGVVRRAINKVSKEEVAVKIIPKVNADRDRGISILFFQIKIKNMERFKMEVEIMKQVDHPHIVRLFEWFEDDKNFYLCMELCSGGELFERIASSGHFTEKEAAIIFKQILSALHYCHDKKIVHRDLKPENFLFSSKKPGAPLKLIDFGLSKIFEDPKIGYIKLKTRAGTPYYIAPEVISGDYNHMCDMWSSGVILYILICGYPPFYGDNDAEILECVKKGDVDFDEEEWEPVTMECKELIRKLLMKDPKKRLTAKQALEHPWIKNNAKGSKEALSPKLLDHICGFRSLNRLMQAVMLYIATRVAEKDIKKIREIFESLDKNGDGKLSPEEIQEAIKAYRGSVNFKEIIEGLDADQSGCIDYSEFLAAAMDRETILTPEKLAEAFSAFDKDKCGKITLSDIKEMVGTDFQEFDVKIWEAIINEFDTNKDGAISLDEFLKMMHQVKEGKRFFAVPGPSPPSLPSPAKKL